MAGKRDNIPPELELFIKDCREEDDEKNKALFSEKWVEKAFTWVLYGGGAIILAGLVKTALPFFK